MSNPPSLPPSLQLRCLWLGGWLAASLVAVSASTASAAPAATFDSRERSESPAIELVEPRAGVEAIAGGELALGWRVRPGAEPAAELEEWEAFLSLDGGASWPFRLTPHLDRNVSRFVATLPEVASEHARLLLRYGDEHDERELLADFEFVVRAPRTAVLPSAARATEEPGESARPDEKGVVSWVDGARDGSGLVRYESGASVGFGRAPSLDEAGDPWAMAESDPLPTQEEARASSFQLLHPVQAASVSVVEPAVAATAPERLALLGRRNE